MSNVEIKLLGGLEIAGGDDYPLARKAKAVAAFLALQNGQPQSRERIAALFWENSPEEQARTNLRQCLSTLRKHFGDALLSNAETVRLDASAVETDTAQFEGLVAGEDRDGLEAATALYKGDLLDGFVLKEEAFEAWVRSERERYRQMMVGGLAKLIGQCESSGDIAAAVKHATRLVALDPINESVHRALMRTYAAQGRHDAALKQFEVCKGILRRELGVEPQPETLELAVWLKSDRSRGGKSQPGGATERDTAAELNSLGIDFALPSKPSVIVLPFCDLSADGKLSHLAEGIRIDVQSALVKISGLFVIAAGTAAAYAGRSVDPEQVSQEVGVRHVLECALQGNSDHIRLTAQLSDGTTGQIVWSERFDRKLDDTFQLQDEIVERIVTSLDVELVSGEQARVWRKTLRNPKALELYYKGLELLTIFNKQSVTAARQLFEKVSEIAPGVTLGPTLVAFCHYWDATMGWNVDPESALDAAARWSRKAAAMDDADGQAHAILAHVELLRRNHDEALQIAEEAIKIRPLCANTNALSGNILLYCGRPKEAIERVRSAIRAAPVYATWWLEILATAYRDADRIDQAIAAARELLRKNAENTNALLILASAMVAQDRLQAARECAATIVKLDPEFSLSSYATQHPYRDKEHLKKLLSDLGGVGLPK